MDARATSGRTANAENATTEAYPTLFRAALVLCDSTADAEDAVQETLARALAAYGSFRGESSPATWMCKILTRVVSERRRKKRPSLPLPGDGGDVAAPQQEPDRPLELREDLQAVLEALRSLPERQREAATLFYLEDLSYDEVAVALGISVGTVKSALCRARLAIRAALSVEGERKVPNDLP